MKHARNPLNARRQCTASAGKTVGRCPNESTHRYAQRQRLEKGEILAWMNRCDAHPMANAAAVEPLEPLETPESSQCQLS